MLAALRTTGRAGTLVVVGYELMDNVKAALIDGTLTLSTSHPLARLAKETINAMTKAVQTPNRVANYTSIVPFDIYTRENI